MAATLALSAGGGRLTYTDTAGTYVTEIVVAHISNYEISNGNNLLIYTSGETINLKFDTTLNRNTAKTLIDVQFP